MIFINLKGAIDSEENRYLAYARAGLKPRITKLNGAAYALRPAGGKGVYCYYYGGFAA